MVLTADWFRDYATFMALSSSGQGEGGAAALASLQAASCLVDLQLVAATGEAVKCHKIVLAAASGLLRRLFEENDEKVSFLRLTNSHLP